jgi:hypothetical protein
MPHVHRDRILKFMLRLQAEYMTSPEQMLHPTVGNMRADFADAIEIPRAFSATCAFADKINVGCLVMAYMPKEIVVYRVPKIKRPMAPVRSFDPILGTCLALAGPTLSPALSPFLSPALSPALRPGLSPAFSPALSPALCPALSPANSSALSPVLESGRTVGPRPGTIAHAFARTAARARAPAATVVSDCSSDGQIFNLSKINFASGRRLHKLRTSALEFSMAYIFVHGKVLFAGTFSYAVMNTSNAFKITINISVFIVFTFVEIKGSISMIQKCSDRSQTLEVGRSKGLVVTGHDEP